MSLSDFSSIRSAISEDLPQIKELMAAFDMYGDFSEQNCFVAQRDGKLVGFARVEYSSGKAYLRPIVVDSQYQGKGIGKALLQKILECEDSLTVIARGSAVGFYSRFGFEPVEWDEIPLEYRNECSCCPDLDQCQPVPLSTISDAVHVSTGSNLEGDARE